jgi:transcriptional regulator with XRE-family HTH domain
MVIIKKNNIHTIFYKIYRSNRVDNKILTNMKTGTKLKLLREKNRMSQEELAHRVGVTQTTIGNWENGKSIKHEYISKLAKALEVPTDYLLIENENNSAVSVIEKENMGDSFEFIIKASNHFFENLNRKIDFLISRMDEKK